MGNSANSTARDAYGNLLEIGTWVECTNTQNGVTNTLAGTGRVRFITDDRITFEFPVFGNYHYDKEDITRWGLRRILADKDGRKLKKDQLVEMPDGSEGVVSSVTDNNATIEYMSKASEWWKKDARTGSRTVDQRGIDEAEVKICGSAARDRSCNKACG